MIRMQLMQVALVPYNAEASRGEGLTEHVLVRVAAALQTQVIRDLSPVWGVSAVVSAFLSLDQVSPGYLPLVIVEGGNFTLTSQGFHFLAGGRPGAVVRHGDGWTVDASHELIEMLCDPTGTATAVGPSLRPEQGQVEYLIEVCDPCENSTYEIDGVPVSDFVTPTYYAPPDRGSGPFSFTGSCQTPLQILEEGYITWRTRASEDDGVWQALAPPGSSGSQGFVPIESLEIRRISDTPATLTRQWVDAHPAHVRLGARELSRPALPSAGEKAAARYGELLRTEIGLILNPPAPSPTWEDLLTVVRKLADPNETAYRTEFQRDPGAKFGRSGVISELQDLPSPERYQGVLQALEQGQRFGTDFSQEGSIEWLSKLAW